MKYTKPPLSFVEQIAVLESRGMAVPDHDRAARYLSHVNYFRLRAYWLPFEHAQRVHSQRLAAGLTSESNVSNLPYGDSSQLAAGRLQNVENPEHRFHPGTTFDSALTLYIFDRKFRLLLLEAIERVEVSLRTNFAYTLAMKYGSHAFMDENIFRKPKYYDQLVRTSQCRS